MDELQKTDQLFVREFRFTLSSDNLSPTFNYSVDIDWLNKKLILCVYEVMINGSVQIIDWATDIQNNKCPEEKLILTTFDEKGTEIYGFVFSGLTLVGRSSCFDYSSSDVAKQIVVIEFNKCEKVKESEIMDTSSINKECLNNICTKIKSLVDNWYIMDTWSFKEALGDTIMEKYEVFYVKLHDIFDRLGGAQWLICGTDVASIFETATSGFKPALCPEGVKLDFYKTGRINNKFDIYVDGSLKDIVYVTGQNGVVRLKIKDFLI